jgi:hypothetical protein
VDHVPARLVLGLGPLHSLVHHLFDLLSRSPVTEVAVAPVPTADSEKAAKTEKGEKGESG